MNASTRSGMLTVFGLLGLYVLLLGIWPVSVVSDTVRFPQRPPVIYQTDNIVLVTLLMGIAILAVVVAAGATWRRAPAIARGLLIGAVLVAALTCCNSGLSLFFDLGQHL